MKRFTLIVLGILFSLSVFAQKGTEIFNEDFSSSVPPAGWTIDDLQGQWSQSASANAGGTAPEAQFEWIQGTFTSHLISPETDLTGITTVIFSFKHFLDDYDGTGYSIGVATRSGGGSWNDVWTVSPTGNVGPETNDILISNADVGASDFQICMYLTGNMYNLDYWYIDDLILLVPDNNDAEMGSINISPFAAASDIDIECTFKNSGLNPITSVDINYQIDGGAIITENLTGLDLAVTETLDHTFATPWAATAGSYTLSVWVSNMNGIGADDDPSNDLKSLEMNIATQSVQNLPLYEEFTSSTCAPCASFNSATFTPFMNAHPDDIAVIKYQMSWPAPGDPYYTLEGGDRRVYYGVSFVPDLFTGGVNTATTSQGVNDAYTFETNKPAFFDITSTFTPDETNITVDVDIMPYLNADFTVHIVVIEKLTTGNVGNNGETEFKHVMMKMLPDASGTAVNFEAGTNSNISETFDLASTNVEQMSDLAVVVFIQNDVTKEIFQAVYSDLVLTDPSVVFDPVDGAIDIGVNSDVVLNFYQSMRLVDDSPITAGNVADFVHLSDPSKGDLTYTAVVSEDYSVITLTPDVAFTESTVITVEVDGAEIENIQDFAFPGSVVTFTTESLVGISQILSDVNIYPNPATNKVLITDALNAVVTFTDVFGKSVLKQTINSDSQEINISKLNSGLYIVNIELNGYESERKLIIVN